MPAEIISLEPDSFDSPEIQRAAKALKEGALVAFRTETVYGLGANAALSESVERLRAVKGRRAMRPFTVHIGRTSDCEAFVGEISPVGRRLVRKGWPGPLTLIFRVDDPRSMPAYERLSEAGVASIYAENSVGIRFPDDRIATSLFNAAGVPIVATSANVSGGAAPVRADQVKAGLGDNVDLIVDGGSTRHRKSSTIVELNGDGYRIVRAGVWDERMIRQLSTLTVLFVCTGNTCRSPMAEGLCKRMLAERIGCEVEALPERGIVVQSAGTLGFSGGRASIEAIEACDKRGIDISGHRSRGLTPELVHPADHIFVMARHHIDAVRSISPGSGAKAMLLDPEAEISDPIGSSLEEYERVAERISSALIARLREVAL